MYGQMPLRRMRVEAVGRGETQLVSTHATLDEAVGAVCGMFEAGAAGL